MKYEDGKWLLTKAELATLLSMAATDPQSLGMFQLTFVPEMGAIFAVNGHCGAILWSEGRRKPPTERLPSTWSVSVDSAKLVLKLANPHDSITIAKMGPDVSLGESGGAKATVENLSGKLRGCILLPLGSADPPNIFTVLPVGDVHPQPTGAFGFNPALVGRFAKFTKRRPARLVVPATPLGPILVQCGDLDGVVMPMRLD